MRGLQHATQSAKVHTIGNMLVGEIREASVLGVGYW